jgi:predicted ATPase
MRCARCGFDTTDLWEVLAEVTSLLQCEGRVTYRALRRRLDCDDAFFDDLREELLFKKLAVDEDEKGLVWIGSTNLPELPQPPSSPFVLRQNEPDGPSGALPAPSSEEPPSRPPAAEQSGRASFSPEADPSISGSEITPEPTSGSQLAETELFDDSQPQPIVQQDIRESEQGPQEELEQEEETPPSPPTRVLVGRDVEVGLLQLRWEQSREGFGQVVLIGGAAGIGKSRLVEELAVEVTQEGARCLAFQCLPEYQTTAWYPLIASLRQRVQGEHQATLQAPLSQPLQEQIQHVEELVRSWHLALEDNVPLLAALLSIPVPEDQYPALRVSAQQQRQRTQDMLAAWLAAEATDTPVLVSWADLQWADPSTLEMLGFVIDQAPSVRALHVLTFRPAFDPPWATHSHLTPMVLERLELAETQALTIQLARGASLPSQLVDYVTDKGDGVPLVTEELTLALLESETLTQVNGQYALSGPVAGLSLSALPATWQEAFLTRLDRVADGREVAQAGAVFGHEYSYEMLKTVTVTATQALQKALSALVQAGIFHQHEHLRSVYTFKHALLRDTVYSAIPEKDRQRLHQRVIRFLERQSPQLGDMYPELLAHHAAAADSRTQAVSYWQQAGMCSIAHFANDEAIQQLDKGGALLATLSDSGERIPYEFALQVSTGLAQSVTKGCGAVEVERAYARARELCQQIPAGAHLSPLYFTLQRFYALRAEYHTAQEIAEQYQQFAERGGDATARLGAHAALGSTSLWLGEYATALEHLEQLNTLYNPDTHRPLSVHYGENLKTAGGALVAWTLWYLGYPEQAGKASDEALSLAQDLASPVDLTWAFIRSAWLHHHCQEVSVVEEHAAAGIALATEHRLPFLAAVGGVLHGWTLCQQGQTEQAIAQIRHGITAAQETGASWGRPYFLALLAEAYERDGQIEEGLGVLVEALGLVRKTDERFCEAELYRLRGELLLARDKRSQAAGQSALAGSAAPSSEAEDCLLLAIKIARRQSAKSWELRASASLSRLWQEQGKTEEARQLLDPIYSWFTEGFETQDVQQVKGLLALPR